MKGTRTSEVQLGPSDYRIRDPTKVLVYVIMLSIKVLPSLLMKIDTYKTADFDDLG